MTGVVEIRPDGDGYAVICVPPDPARPDQWFADPREARGTAGGFRLVTGRTKRDLTDGGAKDARLEG